MKELTADEKQLLHWIKTHKRCNKNQGDSIRYCHENCPEFVECDTAIEYMPPAPI